MGYHAKMHASSTYSWDCIIEQYDQLFSQLANATPLHHLSPSFCSTTLSSNQYPYPSYIHLFSSLPTSTTTTSIKYSLVSQYNPHKLSILLELDIFKLYSNLLPHLTFSLWFITYLRILVSAHSSLYMKKYVPLLWMISL